MLVLPYKERFIRENFIEFSFSGKEDDYLPDFQLFSKLSSTDQYYLAQNYNWDDGDEVLSWIIEDPKCDKGTAALIFWTAEPDFYLQRTEENIRDYQKSTFLLLKRIVEKFHNKEFKKARLKFDPTAMVKEMDWHKVSSEWVIPDELKKPTRGLKPINLGAIQNLIWNWQRQRRFAKRQRKRNQKKG